MADQLEDCVRIILCGLSQPVINALNGALAVLVAPIEAQILFIESQILLLDIATLPVQLAASAIKLVVEEFRSAANILPLNLALGCVDIGLLNLNIVAHIDRLTAQLAEYEQKLLRMLSFKEELAALVAKLEEIKAQYLAVKLVLQGCGAT